jgi:arylsulfatase A-like enzyme/HEAT repeat protein
MLASRHSTSAVSSAVASSPARAGRGLYPALPLAGGLAGAFLAVGQSAFAPLPAPAMGRAALAVAALGVLVGLLEVAALGVFRAGRARLLGWGWARPTAEAVPLTALAAPAVSWLVLQLFAGRRMLALPQRPLLLFATIVVALALLSIGARFVLAGARRQSAYFPVCFPAYLRRAAGGCVLLAVLLCWADGHLLVRRYDWVHLGLQLGALVALQGALLLARLHGAWRPPGRRARLLGSAALALLLVAGWQAAAALWAPEAASVRARVFGGSSAGGPIATSLELWRPSASRAAPRASSPAVTSPARTAAGPPRFRGADVVLVTVDALRADHLSFLGYPRATSPFLDRLARRSTVFERAYTASPHTSFALSSLLTGRHTFALARAGRLDGVGTIAEAFSIAGYHTAGIFPPAVFFVERARFAELEQRRYGFAHTQIQSLDEAQDATTRTDQAIAALPAARETPTFLWVHYFGPHEPYLQQPDPDGAPGFGPRALDRYDEEIRHVDRAIGRLVEHLEQRRRPYIFVLAADHGEEFGEHGGAYHGTSLHDEQIRVPLLVRVPGGAGGRIATPVSTVDLAATLGALVDLPWQVPNDSVDRSALVLGSPGAAVANAQAPAFAELESLKAVMAGEHKLICDTARDYCRSYDLGRDPGERHDLAAARPELVAPLRQHLDGWLARAPEMALFNPKKALLWAAQRWDPAAIRRLGEVLDAGHLGAPEGAPATIEDRREAGRIIARDPRPEHRAALARVLADLAGDGVLRAWAATALATLGDPEALAQVTSQIPRLASTNEPELASRAALALAGAGHPAGPTALIAALARETDVNLRCRLVAALGRARDPRVAEVLLAAYAEVRSRVCVARALAPALRNPTHAAAVRAFLLERMRDEPYSMVRAAVARALAGWKHPAASAALAAAFREATADDVSAAAARSLARLGRAVPLSPRRTLRVPATARELWLLSEPSARGTLRVRAAPRGDVLDAAIDLHPDREAYSLALPAGTLSHLRVTGPATHALFR